MRAKRFLDVFPLLLLCALAGGTPSEASEPVITLGEPIVVERAPEGERRWGRCQFPGIERLGDGRLHVGWHAAEDSAASYGSAGASAVSADGGKTWTRVAPGEAGRLAGGTAFPNGERLKLVSEKAIPLKVLQLPEPAAEAICNYGNLLHKFYRPSDLPESVRRSWPQMRLGAGATTWVREYPAVNIPGEVLVARDGVLAPPFFMGAIVKAPDGAVWTSCYWKRLSKTGMTLYIPTFVRSTDQGRRWEFVSDIPYEPDRAADPKWEKRDGFTEPELAFLPDGSMLAIMRTTDGAGDGPLYTARSTDNGKTWSRPRVFDALGVLPQLLVLENGVTLTVYGRPRLYLRASADPAGAEWGGRVDLPLHDVDWTKSPTCGYTRLLALTPDSAMLVYSDFGYPDADGKPRKTILVRTIIARRG